MKFNTFESVYVFPTSNIPAKNLIGYLLFIGHIHFASRASFQFMLVLLDIYLLQNNCIDPIHTFIVTGRWKNPE